MKTFSVVIKQFLLISLVVIQTASAFNQKHALRSAVSKASCISTLFDERGLTGASLDYANVSRIHLSNLLSHFPEYQQVLLPLSAYKAGDLELCKYTVFLGVYPMIDLPVAFLSDLSRMKVGSRDSPFMWIGQNIDLLPARVLTSMFSLAYKGTEEIKVVQDGDENGGLSAQYFRNISYRDLDFFRDGVFSGTTFQTSQPLVLVEPISNFNEVLAFAKHNTDSTTTPYITRRNAAYFVADSPFSYYHPQDRSQVIGDVFFDFLDVQKDQGPKKAIVRLEDVHANLPIQTLGTSLKFFEDLLIPYTISLIPVFRDPLLQYNGKMLVKDLPLSSSPDFVRSIHDAIAGGASVAMHGVTHQRDEVANGLRGVSGEDFEFWDATLQTPLAEDSSNWLLDRLKTGYQELEQQGFKTGVWITPHYASSALDSIIFGQVFDWQMGRIPYATGCEVNGFTDLPPLYRFRIGGAAAFEGQKRYLGDIQSKCTESNVFAGQVFQYSIFGDDYGQRLIPENLGPVLPWVPGWDDQMKKGLDRNLVLRDAWSSLFVHPYLLLDADIRDRLQGVIKYATEKGYQFVDLKSYVETERRKRLPTLVLGHE